MGNDTLKDLAVKQGYVPETCTFDGEMIMMLTNLDGCACKGCNQDRNVCKGRPKAGV